MASTVLGRQLFHGSLPYTGPPFNPSWGPIGSGRPSAYLFGTPTDRAGFNRLKAECKRLMKPKVSKLAQCFPTETPILAPTNRDDEELSTIRLDDPAIPVDYRPEWDVFRGRCPRVYDHGDMSNLRQDDRGISYDMYLWLFHMSQALDGAMPHAATKSNDSVDDIRRKVTSDLGGLLANLSREERIAACRALRDFLMNSETISAKGMRWQMDMILKEDGDKTPRLPGPLPAERALGDSNEGNDEQNTTTDELPGPLPAERALGDSNEGNDEQNTTTDGYEPEEDESEPEEEE